MVNEDAYFEVRTASAYGNADDSLAYEKETKIST